MATKRRKTVIYDFDRHGLSPEFLRAIREFSDEVLVIPTTADFSGNLDAAHLADAESLILRVFDDYKFLQHAGPNLKYVGTCHTDASHLPLEALRARNIVVTNVRGYATQAVTELTIAMLLSLHRHVPQALCHVRDGGWDVQKFIGGEVSGKTLGIIGFGAVGTAIGKVGLALNMRVTAHSRSSINMPGVTAAPLSDLMRTSDAVVVCCPLNVTTKNLVNDEMIDAMRPGTILLVPARNELIDCESAYRRCKSGEISIWFDELQDEKLRERFRILPQAFLTPDYGWLTFDALKRQEQAALENFKNWARTTI